MIWKTTWKFGISLALCAGFFAALQYSLVFADEYTSTNFTSDNPIVNGFGGTATSTSFSTTQGGEEVATGESTSTNFALLSGSMYYDSFTPKSKNWQWFDDEGSETPVTALAAENVAPSAVDTDNVVKLRISISETADIGAQFVKFKLQYSTSSDFSTGGYDLAPLWNCTGSSVWCYADGAGADNALITTAVLSDPNSCVASVGNGCGTHNESATSTSSYDHGKSMVKEYEFTLVESGAISNTVYFFRAFDVSSTSSVPLDTGETYPSISTNGAQLTFSINGLATSTATEGISTEIGTTPTGVPFGSLLLGDPVIAAQRLTVSTNAAQGYQIYAFQQQGFLGPYGDEIEPVAGTNASPTGWSTGCYSTSTGCYGYHAGEDVLSGGSTRFSANDTFAKFTASPAEIAYSSGPISNDDTDMVYKVEAHQDQPAGDYSTGVVYIVVPTF